MADQTLATCLAKIKANPGKFNVYILRRPDGRPFYVGCGKVKDRGRQRIAAHEVEARNDALRTHKANAIRLIWRSGRKVKYSLDSWHLSEAQMFAREIELIALIGRADLKRGPLTNWSDGGDGLVNRSSSVIAKASRTMKSLVDDDWRRRSSERIRAHWASPEGRAKRLAANARPETRARQSAAAKAIAAGEGNVRRSKTMSATWQCADYRARQKAAHLAAMSNESYRRGASEQSLARWSDEGYRERLRQTHLRRWAARRAAQTVSNNGELS